MHHKYTTPGLVIRQKASADSAYLWILTRDLGLVVARAQGLRKGSSRLKGMLSEFSFGDVVFVHSRAGWKVTTAIASKNFWYDTAHPLARQVLAHVADTVIRMLPVEEKDEKIFSLVTLGLEVLSETDDPTLLEVLILARLLYRLGYIALSPETKDLLSGQDFSSASLALVRRNRASLVQAINQGLAESQL